MRILPLLILILIALDPDQAQAKRKKSRGKGKGGKDKDAGPCGKSYLSQLNGKCYYISNKKINWFGAQNNCLRKDLNLADLSTPDDYNAVVQNLREIRGPDDYWFGGNDLQVEGRFTYISSGRVVRYYGELGLVEPTYRSNLDDCLTVRIRSNNTVVLDDNCQEKKYFVCEKFNQQCAYPGADADDEQHHSHEHLHHFHHDAGKGEKETEAPVEADSRPLDNTNSTEIGESKETGTEPQTEVTGESEATTATGGEDVTTADGGVDVKTLAVTSSSDGPPITSGAEVTTPKS